MAQRTAFLNSDAKGYNKDFHHTWIHNYLLHQVGVMFTDYNTKNEFKLGNGQISGGKAIIRCTRTTGNFAGSKILALFESTATESISTSGDKKVFIEIPEIYVNDSTAITDTLTQGLNLGVGVIKSEADYPSHTNYIPLWEISNGDWQNATDVRPEVLRRGKPNTISYFGGNGEEERIDIDNESLNKFLMSNGAGNRPTWEEGTGGGGGSGENFKRTFTADENLLAKSMFGVEVQGGLSDVDSSIAFGKTTATKVFFPIVINGEDFSSIVLNLKAVNSPSDSLSVRIETLDANGQPSGTLVDVGAYGTVSPTGTATDTTINLSGTVTGLTAHTKAAIVLERSGTTSDSNYYELGCVSGVKVISQIYINNGTAYSAVSYSGCVSCDGFATEALVQATSLNGVEWTGYCETGATAGNDFTGILQGTVDYTGATTGTKYYLTSTGVLGTSGAPLVGYGVEDGVLKIESGTTINGESGALSMKTINSQSLIGSGNIQIEGQKTYDAIVASDGSGDYTNVRTALLNDKRRIFIRNGTYNHENEYWDAARIGTDILIEGESKEGVIINFTSTSGVSSSNRGFIQTRTGSGTSAHGFKLCNVTINVTPGGGDAGDNGPYNALFKDTSLINYNNPWIVDNCDIYLDSTNGAAVLCDNVRMGSNVVMGRIRTRTDRARVGFFGCNIETKGHNYRIGLSGQPYGTLGDTTCFYDCYIKSSGSMGFGVRSCRFNNCKVRVGNVDGQSLRLYCTSFDCDNIFNGYSYDGGQVSIPEIIESRLSVSTDTSPSGGFRIGGMSLSKVFLSANTNTLAVEQDINGGGWYNSFFRCKDNNSTLEINKCIIGCEIECDAITIDASGENISGCVLGYSANGNNTLLEGIVTGCSIVGSWTIIGDDYYSYNGTGMVGCKCTSVGQSIILNGEGLVFTGNYSFNLEIELGENASKCVVTGNYLNSFETKDGSTNCVIVGNAIRAISHHSAGTGHVYANNYD